MNNLRSTQDLAALRRNYALKSLNEEDVSSDPLVQFDAWFGEALASDLPEPNAMTLATVDRSGQPTARTVLLKGFDERGFIFYTNYESQKGKALDVSPQCALLFTWLELERQIRIEGLAERLDRAESEAYFQSRPRESQIGAWASPQSAPLPDRSMLESRVQEITQTFKHDEALPLPPFWGGYLVRPRRIEFWQGRESRLHDRIQYTMSDSGLWSIQRLAP